METIKNKDMEISQIRKQKRAKIQMIPKNVTGESGLVQVDITWGIIQPMQVTKDVLTVGELEVYNHHQKGLPIIDTRKLDTSGSVTISGSRNIPYNELVERVGELDKNHPSIFFCNGPQCPQSPAGIKNLLKNGYPADKILYYRGGMHDWITLGLPLKRI